MKQGKDFYDKNTKRILQDNQYECDETVVADVTAHMNVKEQELTGRFTLDKKI